MQGPKLTKDDITQSFRKRSIFQRIKESSQQFRKWAARVWEKVVSNSQFKRGAAWGAVITTVLLAGGIGFFLRPGIWKFMDIPLGILMVLVLSLFIFIVSGIAFGILYGIATFIGWKGFMAVVTFVFLMIIFYIPVPLALVPGLLIVLIEALLGGSIAYCFTSGFKFGTWTKKTLVILGILAAIAVNVLMIKWIINPGSDTPYLSLKTRLAGAVSAPETEADDPSRSGPFHVIKMTYGGSDDNRRPEFGREADLKTGTVDARPFFKNSSGWKRKLRKWYWKYDLDAVPVNGTVWLPAGDGSFPLLIMVHGDYRMDTPSDRGFGYLGELLAGKGFICVSPDLNGLNSSWSGTLPNAEEGRAWLILQHLVHWRQWSETEGNPFYRKVDMSHIGLLGHGTGAEALVKALLFNRLNRYPGDARVEFDFNFNIKSLAALAPRRGEKQNTPGSPSLANLDLLCIQGVHDSLSAEHWGDSIYNNLVFNGEPNRIKSLIYSYRSNHNQFNSEWHPADYRFPLSLLLNRRLLLGKNEQQQVCRIFVSAFFEASLRGRSEYLPLFHLPRSGSRWLPDDIYIGRFQDSNRIPLCSFEEDADASTGATPGITIKGENLILWREGDIGNNGVVLGWQHAKKSDPVPVYRIEFSGEVDIPDIALSGVALDFAIADVTGILLPRKSPAEETPGIDISVEISTRQDQRSKISLKDHALVPVPPRRRITRLFFDDIIFGKDPHILLQTVEIPLQVFFKETPPGMKLKDIASINFIFDRTPRGAVLLDDIGLARIPPASGSLSTPNS